MSHSWQFRPITVVGDDGGPDIDIAFGVVAADEGSLDHPSSETRASLLGRLLSPESVPGASELAFDADGNAVGATIVLADPNSRSVYFDSCTLPHLERRAELTDLLLSRGLDQARRVAAERGGHWNATCRQIDVDAHYAAALERAGLSEVRHFLRMRIDLTSTTPDEPPPWPSGAELITSPNDADLRELHDVLEEAFADHWDFHPWPFDEWLIDITLTPEFVDRELWWLVRVDSESAAAVISDLSRRHLDDLYVRELGVRRSFRGRGLARTILLRSFAEAQRRGFSGVQLGVDAESLTDAVRLYESVGMRVTSDMVLWRIELD